MLFNVGDYVTRSSHNHDMIFKIKEINDDVVILEGVNIRLIADAPLDDLKKCDDQFDDITKEDRTLYERMQDSVDLNRDQYFYLPGKVLHIDSDKDYLNRCIKFYKDMNIASFGVVILEDKIHLKIKEHLEKIRPDVLVITGHDAYYERDGDYKELSNYKNSKNFVKAVQAAREYEKDHEKLIIIAGACQSDYEELIKAGSNFASSPRRINIHALDPAIIASSICLSNKNEPIDLKKILSRTKYGKDGIGGIITNGTMYVGYPR